MEAMGSIIRLIFLGGLLVSLLFAYNQVKKQKEISEKINSIFIKDIEILLKKIIEEKEENKIFKEKLIENIDKNSNEIAKLNKFLENKK